MLKFRLRHYQATITIGARDLAGNNLGSDYVWNFTTGDAPDIAPPTVISTDPLNNATGVALNKKIAATFSETMNPLTITTSTFTVRRGTTPVSGKLTYVGAIAVFKPDNNLAANTIYTATITIGAMDLAGNALASNYIWSFTTAAVVDIIPPTVISTDPVNNATGVALNKKIAATFNEAMDQSTITTATVTVTGLGGVPVTGTVSYASGSNTMTFAPASDLGANTTYTGTIKSGNTGAKDLAGNALASNYIWSFTTGAALDITPPTVVFTDPICGSPGVFTNKKLAVTFSEAMNQATITAATFTVTGPGGASVAGTVTYVAANKIATFATTNFVNQTVYTFTIHSGVTGVKDLAGNPLASDFVCGFQTGPAPDTVLPAVTSTDPANSATGVPVTKIITATFSEAMDPLTILAPGTFTLKQGLTVVTGTVSYFGTTVTFTPGSNLALNTIYTATITAAAQDLAANAMASNYEWSFRTIAPPPGIAPVNLLSTANFVILAGSMVTNIPTSNITGDVGLSPAAGSNYAGLTAGEVAGITYAVDATGPGFAVPNAVLLTAAKGDLTIAYNDAAGRTPIPTGPFLNPGSGNIGGLTLVAGLYKFTTTAEITGSDVTLTGSATDVWIFQIGTSFNVGNGIKVILGGSAEAKNIFWQVGSSATLGTTSVVQGTIMADMLISLATGATLNGRALTFTGAVTLDQAILVRPPL